MRPLPQWADGGNSLRFYSTDSFDDGASVSLALSTLWFSFLRSGKMCSGSTPDALQSTASVTDGGSNTITLATNYYDGATSSFLVNYGPGNLTKSITLTGTTSLTYNANGTIHNSTVNGVTTTASYTGSPNSAAPSQLTVGSLSENMSYNTFLGLTGNTGPNGDTSSVVYMDISRPLSSTSPAPYNLQTTYVYYNTPNVTVAAVNGRWTRTTKDGLGRTTKVENGTSTISDANVVNQTDTAYDSCGCSPFGKLKQTSLPHARGAGAVWTTYTYDGIGRTLSVQLPDGASTTTYSYQGNTVTVTDPAGAWKTYTSDAFGRLTTVVEPNPAGGTFSTTYTYDLLDHLTGVSMPRPTGTQTRQFQYNNTAFLQSATNPENGTVTYTYDSQNRLSTVVDAKNQKKVFTYDSYNRVTQVQRYVNSGGTYVEDPMQRTNFYFDSNPFGGSTYVAGRLAALQYYGGHCSSYVPSGTQSGCDLLQEWYSYDIAGARLSKTLQVTRGTAAGSMKTSWTYDSEGRTVSVTYPGGSCFTCTPSTGSSYTYAYDTMGRPNTLTDTVNTRTLVSGMTYGVANEVQQMTSGYTAGVNTETRHYNGIFQLTQLQVGSSALNIQYSYSATQNNGKITSESNLISGEQIAYTYDALNRLASAQTTQTGGTQWGQSYTYDGFGNLTDQTGILGSPPDVHVAYNYLTNRQVGDSADANGNIGSANIYDLENRLVQPSGSTARYGYDANNKRVWRGDTGVDEIAFWAGQKLATYQISNSGGYLSFTLTSTNVYFGGKLISKGTYNSSGSGDVVTLAPVVADRQGSISRFYPYGTERPSATGNDKEKFTGYYRDASTGLDYADQRYEQPGVGRFMSPDPFDGSATANNPGSWNRYAYVGGDPVNRTDPSGLLLWVGGNGGNDTPDYSFTTAFVMGGMSSSRQVPSWQVEWDSLSADCQLGLRTKFGTHTVINAMIQALNRALADMDTLTAAAEAHGIDPALLAAVGMRETGFRDINQGCAAGVTWSRTNKDCSGAGYFQIDLFNHPEISTADARNLSFAADWAANTLAGNVAYLANKFPNFTPDQLLQATAASYNLGRGGISGNPNTIDGGTQPDGKYGSNVLNLMTCFQ